MDIAADGTDPLFGLFLLDGDKVFLPVLTQGTEVVIGDLIAFVDIAADGTDPLLFGGRSALRLGLDVALVISVGAGGLGRENTGVSDLGDEENMTAQIQMLSDLGGENSIGGGGQVIQTVFAAGNVVKALELIGITA